MFANGAAVEKPQGAVLKAAGNAVLIEFVGLPGSGKSSISQATLQRLTAEGLNIKEANRKIYSGRRLHSAAYRVWLAGVFFALRAEQRAKLITSLRRSGQRTGSDFRAVLVNWLVKCDVMAQLVSKDGTYISDEGVLHAVWSMMYAASQPDVLVEPCSETIARLLPRRWVVVVVETDGAVAIERLLTHAPGRNRLVRDVADGLLESEEKARRGMDMVQRTLERVVALRPDADVTVLSLDNGPDSDPGSHFSRLRNFIQ